MMMTTTTMTTTTIMTRMNLILCFYSIFLTIAFVRIVIIRQPQSSPTTTTTLPIPPIPIPTTTSNKIKTLLSSSNSSKPKLSSIKSNYVDDDDDDDDDNYNNNTSKLKRKYAIVHVGPPKTGSTTIQYMIDVLHKELQEDQYQLPNYFVPNNYHLTNHAYLSLCFTNYKEINYNATLKKQHCDPSLVLQVTHIASRNKHLLLSSERFSEKHVQPKLLYNLLSPYHSQSTNNQIKIVIYYRRFYEWISSLHYELNRFLPIYKRQSIIYWLNNMNIIQKLQDNVYISGSYKRHYKYFKNIQIMNMHNPNHNLIVNFFCNGLIDANTTCAKARNMEATGKLNHIELNKGIPFVYEELVDIAFQMNLISSSYYIINKNKRQLENNNNQDDNKSKYNGTVLSQLSLKAREYQEDILLLNQYNFTKWICPDDKKINRILQITLDVENELLPEFYKSGNQKNIITNDFNYMKYKKFCIVDVKYILSNNINDWKKFFMSL